jgi:hypothetical protein
MENILTRFNKIFNIDWNEKINIVTPFIAYSRRRYNDCNDSSLLRKNADQIYSYFDYIIYRVDGELYKCKINNNSIC